MWMRTVHLSVVGVIDSRTQLWAEDCNGAVESTDRSFRDDLSSRKQCQKFIQGSRIAVPSVQLCKT